VGDITHELRTPLATLQGYLEGLLDGVIEPDERTWAKLHDEAGRLRRLIDDLQELSRAQAHQIPLKLTSLNPLDITRVAVERVSAQFKEKGLDFSCDLPANLPPVKADFDRAVQVLTNLLINALRYTPAPGRVKLKLQATSNTVEFRVTDSGIGIGAEHLPHLFERFYRVDKSRSRALGGSGIGLTIAKALAEAMGGRIEVSSPGPNLGATFSFFLPEAA
jgi:signal transduction histidine kinase